MHWQVLEVCRLREISWNVRSITGQSPSVFHSLPLIPVMWEPVKIFFLKVLILPNCVRMEHPFAAALWETLQLLRTQINAKHKPISASSLPSSPTPCLRLSTCLESSWIQVSLSVFSKHSIKVFSSGDAQIVCVAPV